MKSRQTLSLLLSITLGGSAALAAPGDVDQFFNPNVNNTVRALVMQTDGRLVAGGDFTSVGGQSRSRLCRFLPNDSLDTGFAPSCDNDIYCLGVQTSGMLIAGGQFTQLAGGARTRLGRFTAAGALDSGFNVPVNDVVRCLDLPLTDSWIYAGGDFTNTSGTTVNSLLRFNTAGTRDTAYNSGVNYGIFSTVILADGKVLIGGYFSSISGHSRARLARLNSNGSLDTAFNPVVNDIVRSIVVQPDGRIVIAGNFSVVNGTARSRIARLMQDGSLDTSFTTSANNSILAVSAQADGKLIIGGLFTELNATSRPYLARLLPDGGLDTTFTGSADNNVYCLLLRPDGKIDVGGQFTRLSGAARNRLGRLLNDPATATLEVPSLQRVKWHRSGTAPELVRATFEISTNSGASWSLLGDAARVADGWEIAGLSLPVSGHIRARGRVLSGYGNGSSWFTESTAPFSANALELWRQTHFGTPLDSGPAANKADPDRDGLHNLVEFAFGLQPNTPDAAALPAWVQDDDGFIFNFNRPPGVQGISYHAEYSPDLSAESWISLPNLNLPPAYAFAITAPGQKLFLRVRVTAP